jgi:hypothetical protein
MASRWAFIKGIGMVDLLKASTTVPPPVAVGNQVIQGDFESATVGSPMLRPDLWDFLGVQYGSYSNLTNTSVVQTDGVGGVTTKVWDQFYPAVVSGSTSNYAMPPTGTGIALTSCPLAGGGVDMDYRMKGSGGTPWGWGGKIPGLGGVKPGAGSVPSGGSPSPNGWSGRLMFRRLGTAAQANLQANVVGYLYTPSLPANSIGNDLPTGKLLTANKWHHLKQYYKMNTVTTEGSTTPPADGIHRIWVDGVLSYESTTTVFRYYTTANINAFVWDNFYGGNDASDGAPWGPVIDTHQQFDNVIVTTF